MLLSPLNKLNKAAYDVTFLTGCCCFLLLSSLSTGNIRLADAQLSGCQYNPCKNGAKCVNEPDTLYGYRCICNGPFTGTNCDTIGSSSGSNGFPTNNNNADGGGSIIFGGNSNLPSNAGGGNIIIGNNDNSNRPYSSSSMCMNGGTFIKQGLACVCLAGFSGNKCQFSSGSAYFPSSVCTINPCYNRGSCYPISQNPGFRCSCPFGYTGTRCEYRAGNSRALGISLGSIIPFLFFLAFVGLCIYCCCFKKRVDDQPNRFIPNVFNATPGQNNRPFQPVYPNRPPPQQQSQYPQPPMNMSMPDPDQVFKAHSPPPYESVVANDYKNKL